METKTWNNSIGTRDTDDSGIPDPSGDPRQDGSFAFTDGDFTAFPLSNGDIVVTHRNTPFYFRVRLPQGGAPHAPAVITATLHAGKFVLGSVREPDARHAYDMTWPAGTPNYEVMDDICAAFHRYLWEFPCTFRTPATRRKRNGSGIGRWQILGAYDGDVAVTRIDGKDSSTPMGVFDAAEMRSAWRRFRTAQTDTAAIGRELGERYALSLGTGTGTLLIRAQRSDMPGTSLALRWHPLLLGVGRVTMEAALPEGAGGPAGTGMLGQGGRIGEFEVLEAHEGLPRRLALTSSLSAASVVCLRPTDVPRRTASVIECFFALMAWQRCESVEITVAGRRGAVALTPAELLDRAAGDDPRLRAVLAAKMRAGDPYVTLRGGDADGAQVRMPHLCTVLRAAGPSAASLRP